MIVYGSIPYHNNKPFVAVGGRNGVQTLKMNCNSVGIRETRKTWPTLTENSSVVERLRKDFPRKITHRCPSILLHSQ